MEQDSLRRPNQASQMKILVKKQKTVFNVNA